MRRILVTGGTVFVSRYVSEYFADKGDAVYVLNRNHRPQPRGCTLIEADRHQLGDRLRQYVFDAVLDVTAYTGEDVSDLLDALGGCGGTFWGIYTDQFQRCLSRDSAAAVYREYADWCESILGSLRDRQDRGGNRIAEESSRRVHTPAAISLRTNGQCVPRGVRV